MGTQTPKTLISESVFQVDATRPFRSVKEAVAILGERFLHGGVKSSSNRPSCGLGNAGSCSSDATQSPGERSGPAGKPVDVASILDERPYSSEIMLGPSETTTASKQVDQSPVYELTSSFEKPEKAKLTENPNTPTNPSATAPALDEKTFLPENTLNPIETQSIASKRILESPMYRPIPSPEEPEKDNLTQSLNKPTNSSFGKQTAGSSFNGPSNSSGITMDDIELPNNKLTPTPRNPSKENNGSIVHGNDIVMMLMVLKKLEVDLQETKMEVKLLKERGSETEVAIASLNAEFHKNMSKIAKAEAAEAAKAATKSITSTNEGRNKDMETRDEERKKTDLMAKSIDSPTLAQILSISDYEGYFRENKLRTRKQMKKKPIIPLVTDLFPWKKKSSPSLDISEPLFSKMYFT